MVTMDCAVEVLVVQPMPAHRPKLPRIMFYPVLAAESGEWRLLAHYPGLPHKYVSGFTGRAEAEVWASGPEAQAWIRANYQASD